jgi:DNA modification methylase
MNFQIKEELKNLIPPLTKEEFRQLEDNIFNDGIRDALVIGEYLEEGQKVRLLIDGHNRYEIATNSDFEYKTKTIKFKGYLDIKEWMINHQFGRRNLNNYQRSTLALQLESVYSLKAKENQAIQYKGGSLSVISPEVNSPVDTRKSLSKIANVGEQTIARVKKLEEKATPEIKEQLRTGEMSINQAYKEVRKVEKKEAQKAEVIEKRVEVKISNNIKNGDSLEILKGLKDGCIDVLLTDPPYGISYVSNRSLDPNAITKRGLLNDGKEDAFLLLRKTCEILLDKMATNSHLYFFCSWSVYPDFISIIGEFFDIKTPIVWDKGNKGSGDLENDWGNQTEIIIYCVKGKKLVNNRRGNLINVSRLHTSKMVHPTQKPDELLRQILEVSYNVGDFVVDPFMGSGSTIKVCDSIGAQCLGIELDKEMFLIANNYING